MAASILAFALTAASPALAGKPRHAAMAIDANTGQVLYNEDGDEARHPASLTKMMTLYLAFETIEAGRMTPSTRIRISPNAANAPPSKLGLDAGDEITVLDAIKVLITKSANDIAVALAEKIGGTHGNFVQLMNTRARELGMSKTRFKNASGLPDPEQITTARDMITLALRLQDDYPAYYPLFATRSITVAGKTMRNHNTLMNSYQGIDGIKTGYTRMSGFNLVSSVRRGGRHVVAAVFGGSSAATRNGEMRVLLTKSLTRAGTKKTRRPAPALIARLKTPPKIAMRPNAKDVRPPAVIASAQPAERREVKPFAPAAAPASVANSAPSEPRRAARVIASLDVVPAAVQPPAPVEVFRVKRVLLGAQPAPAARAAEKPLDPDMTTDMESLIEATVGVSAGTSDAVADEDTIAGSMTISSLAARYTAATNTTTITRTLPFANAPAPVEPNDTSSPSGIMTVGLGAPVAQASDIQTLAPAVRTETASLAKLGAPDVAPAAAVDLTPASGRSPSTLHAQASGLRADQTSTRATASANAGRIEIQIGAFGSADEARLALANVQSRAGSALANAAPVTQPVEKDGRMMYRARFSGFDASRAATACTELRRQSIDCFVMASR